MVPCVRTRNGISTGSSILAGVTFVTDKLTDHDDDKYCIRSLLEVYTRNLHGRIAQNESVYLKILKCLYLFSKY